MTDKPTQCDRSACKHVGVVESAYRLSYLPGGRDYDAHCARCGLSGRWNVAAGFRWDGEDDV